jgi:hypothetical protein
MIQSFCKKCRHTYYMHNRFDSDCPWCDADKTESRRLVWIVIASLSILGILLVLFP